MGTHPIFESDFDCLTGPFVSAKMSLIEEQSASVAATTATSTTTRAKLENQSSCDSGVSSDYESFSDEDKQLESLSIELPLNRHWSFYYLSNTKEWTDRINHIGTIKSVQQFWAIYNHVKLPTHISVGCDLMLFQSDIEPKWENDANREGGRLVVEMAKSDRNETMIANWLNTILGLIGEHCSEPHVAKCYGVQFQSRRKADKISLWVASGHTKDEIKNLGAWFLDGLKTIQGDKVKYNSHMSQSGKTTSSRRYDFCVAR